MTATPELPLINTFSTHYRQRYGEAIGKIPIDAGVVCPNRQLGGCIFCRPASFTPGYLTHGGDISAQLARGRRQFAKGRFTRYLAYFQQETCTALPVRQLTAYVSQLLAEKDCVGLILSTRPDQLPDALLPELARLVAAAGKECLFELGMQTAHDHSLNLLNRNHTMADVSDAVKRIRASGPFGVGVHLIFGIPGESTQDMLDSLTTACQLGVDAVKLHHLQVIRDTPLHQMYMRGEVQLFSREGYMEFLLQALPLIPAKVVIHRLWATAHPDLLVAPKWNVLAAELSGELVGRMKILGARQGQLFFSLPQPQPDNSEAQSTRQRLRS